MTESRYTLTEMSGQFHLAIQVDHVDQDHPEPVSRTCQRAFDDLTAKGLIPAEALITDISVSRPVASMLRCAVTWAGKP